MSDAPLTATTPAAPPDKKLRGLARSLVLDRLKAPTPPPLRLNFDGPVLGTTRSTAVRYKRHKGGQSTYNPMFCPVAQTGRLRVSHCPRNAHDSSGARAFIFACVNEIRYILPSVILEVRMDRAFVSAQIIHPRDARGVQYTISVRFERSARLTANIETRRLWRRVDRDVTFFDCDWKPTCRDETRHFIVIRTHNLQRRETPAQLHLFIACAYEHQFTVFLTTATPSTHKLPALHNRRGAQKAIFADLQCQTQLDHIPCKRRAANSAMTAHSLKAEPRLSAQQPAHSTSEQPTKSWSFARPSIRGMRLRPQDRCLIKPNGYLTPTSSASLVAQTDQLHNLKAAARGQPHPTSHTDLAHFVSAFTDQGQP